MRAVEAIRGFHAHVYFDPDTRANAERLRELLAQRFDVTLGRSHEQPIGPHTKAMYQVELRPEQLGPLVTWLMLNRDGLSILVHPMTDDEIADHLQSAVWLGEPLPFNLDFVRAYLANRSTDY